MTFTPNCRAARTAPSTSALGAWSPPIASNATVSICEPELLLCDFDYFAAFVLPAVRAHAVRQFGLVTVGTFRKARRLQRIVRAPRCSPPLGVSTFGIRHISSTFYNLLEHRVAVREQPRRPVSSLGNLQIPECAPAACGVFHFTIAGGLIPVLAALRANAPAIFAANPLHRQC